jgi:hypothetical protein
MENTNEDHQLITIVGHFYRNNPLIGVVPDNVATPFFPIPIGVALYSIVDHVDPRSRHRSAMGETLKIAHWFRLFYQVLAENKFLSTRPIPWDGITEGTSSHHRLTPAGDPPNKGCIA